MLWTLISQQHKTELPISHTFSWSVLESESAPTSSLFHQVPSEQGVCDLKLVSMNCLEMYIFPTVQNLTYLSHKLTNVLINMNLKRDFFSPISFQADSMTRRNVHIIKVKNQSSVL